MTTRLLLLAVAVSACAGGGDGSDVGRVQASLLSSSGAPMSLGAQLGVKEVVVTIEKVTAHSSTAGWVQISSNEVKVDVLKLADYAQPLGFQNVPAGKITQLRLYVKEGGDQYVIRTDGQRVDLKVPSGIQSGIKIKGMFDVNGCELSSVPLQLDAKHSIWVHDTGREDLWILRPVIRTGKVDATSMPCDPTGGTGGGDGSIGGAGGGNGSIGGTGGGNGSIGGTGGGSGSVGGTGGGITEGSGGTGGVPPGGGMGGTGTVCTTGTNCLSGECSLGRCTPGGADAPCNSGSDCASGECTAGACAPGNAVGTGAPCALGAACLSGSCVNGACEPGGQGKLCVVATDCLSGYSCTAGACQAPIN